MRRNLVWLCWATVLMILTPLFILWVVKGVASAVVGIELSGWQGYLVHAIGFVLWFPIAFDLLDECPWLKRSK